MSREGRKTIRAVLADNTEALDTFRPQAENANKHNPRGLGLLEKSIQTDGWIGAITVAADGETFDGSARLEVGVAANFEDAIVIESDGTRPIVHIRTDIPTADDPRARRLSVAANQIAASDWSPDASILAAWAEDDPTIRGLWPDEAWAGLLSEIQEPVEIGGAGDDFDPTPAEGPTRCQPGDLWEIGPHRLLVGDCTDPANVERLMGGERAALIFEDPPYNVSYQDNESIESLKARNRRTDGKVVENDSMTDEEFDRFLDTHFSTWPLAPGGVYYLCAPAGHTETQFRNALNRVSGCGLRQCIVWVKDRFVFGRQDYHWRHESILYGWREGAAHYFLDDRTQDTVWEIERPVASPDHPTQKPVELALRAIRNSSKPGAIVFDGFAGSGTTLIAAHQLGRVARLCELSPRYADVILRRAEAAHLPCVRQSTP